ncbi:MAG: hypothetical protein ABTR07_04330 [Candidatus Competibacter denitrificans]
MAQSITDDIPTPKWNRQYPAAFSGERGKPIWDALVGTPSEAQPRTGMEARWSALTAPQGPASVKPAPSIAQPTPGVAAAKPAVELQPIAQMPTVQPIQPQASSVNTMGGNRLSVMDQGNGGTVEGNVAAINRQTEALRSLREAQNPGITTGTNQGAFGDVVSIGTPGGNFGDEAMRAEKIRGLIGDAANGRGFSQGRRSAMLDGAQALATMNQQPGVTRLLAQNMGDPYKLARLKLDTQRLGIDQQTNATRLAMERDRLGLDQKRFGLDQQKAGLGALRQSALDQSTLAKNARPTPDQIKAELQRRYLAGGPDAQQALAHLQKLFPPNNGNPFAELPQ